MAPVVTAVSGGPEHRFTKHTRDSIRLAAGLGVEGDAHAGRLVRHRSRIRIELPRPPHRALEPV